MLGSRGKQQSSRFEDFKRLQIFERLRKASKDFKRLRKTSREFTRLHDTSTNFMKQGGEIADFKISRDFTRVHETSTDLHRLPRLQD